MDYIAQLSPDQALLFLKICYVVRNEIQKELIEADSKKVSEFAGDIFGSLFDEGSSERRMYLGRLAIWSKRCGLGRRLWEAI